MRFRQAVLATMAVALAFVSIAAAAPARVAAATTGRCTSALMTPDFPQGQLGQTITFTASSTTCATPQYEFFLQKAGVWVPQTAYGGPTWAWNTTGLKGGTYWVGVWARDTGSTARYEAYWIGTYGIWVQPCTAAAISTIDMTQPYIGIGASVQFTLGATNCQTWDSRVWLKKPGSAWKMVRDYGANTWTWNTKGFPQGTYLVGLWVRGTGSAKAYEAYDIATYYLAGSMPTPCSTGLTLQPSAPAPQVPGASIAFDAYSSVCGGVYEFWMKPPGKDWIIIRPYRTGTEIIWNTTGAAWGTYEIGVWEKLAGSRAKYMSYAIITYRLGDIPCTTTLLESDLASPQAPGAKITFQGAASDCRADLEYWLEPSPGAPWVLLQGYAPSNPYTLDTTGAPAGQIRVGVWARAEGSHAKYEAYAIVSYYLGT